MTLLPTLALHPSGQGAELTLPNGHSVRVPLDHRTGGILERILLAQGAAGAKGRGTTASPTESMIREWMSYGGKPTKIEPAKAAPRQSNMITTLEELGL